ncbi:hypothetical protein Tsubulata_039579, partial [Turnera subulata]
MATTPMHIVPNPIKPLTDLKGDTYKNWRACMITYFMAQDLLDVIYGDPNNSDSEEEADGDNDWRKKNAAALLAIQTSCAPEIFTKFRSIGSAKLAWNTLADMKEQEQESAQKEQYDVYYGDIIPEGLQFSVEDVPGLPKDWTVQDYQHWSTQMRTYFSSKGLWDGIIEFTGQSNGATSVVYDTWRKQNFTALRSIQASFFLSKEDFNIQDPFGAPHHIPKQIRGVGCAKIAWDILASLNQPESPPDTPPPELSPRTKMRQVQKYWRLLAAMNKGDWDTVKKEFVDRDDGTTLTTAINEEGETLIEAAIKAGQQKITRNLIDKMSAKELELPTSEGGTALMPAVLHQNLGIIECLIRKNEKLVQLPEEPYTEEPTEPTYPVTWASIAANKEITRYIYNRTPIQLLYPECGNAGSDLLQISIYKGLFDIALDLLQKCPRMCFGLSSDDQSPLTNLAEKPSAFYGLISKWHDLVSDVLYFLGITEMQEMKLNHAYAMDIVAILCKEISTGDYFYERVEEVEKLLFSAVENGTKEIVVAILDVCPSLINARDSQDRSLIMTATASRQEKIFRFLVRREHAKIEISVDSDNDGNTMLHLAGLLPPAAQLAKISGAALQMQRELQWFKEVERVTPIKYVGYPNSNGDTARQLFTKSHKQLKDEGEQWMKQTASSSTVVGALIITIMFTAAFTVPGGNVQETGLPIFRRSKTFLIFIISDAISLFSSSTSVLMFLGILTSRYAEDDFLQSLPEKLILGLSSLFLSIVAMMIAFSATLIIMLHGRLSVIIPVVLLAGVPIYLFARLQFPLLVEIFMSTYFGFFRRKKIQEAFVSR